MSGSTSRFLDTRGYSTLGIGICARCSTKRSLTELVSDPNASGLKVCRDPGEGCLDRYDPYRMPTRSPDKISLPFYRPDEPLIMPFEFIDDSIVSGLRVTEDGAPRVTEQGAPRVVESGGRP